MADAVVAGHLCLDITPDLTALVTGQFDYSFQPGKLVHSGPLRLRAGGSVANTGLALHRLGIKTRLIARIGEDQLGKALPQTINDQGADLAEALGKKYVYSRKPLPSLVSLKDFDEDEIRKDIKTHYKRHGNAILKSY